MDIIEATWRSGRETVGIVAYKTFKDQWCAAIGPASTGSEEYDARQIAEWGCKLSWQEAAAFFPHLDITQYKYAPKGEKP
jgi:hypothetical protein